MVDIATLRVLVGKGSRLLALRVVAREKPMGSLSTKNERQLPCESVNILCSLSVRIRYPVQE